MSRSRPGNARNSRLALAEKQPRRRGAAIWLCVMGVLGLASVGFYAAKSPWIIQAESALGRHDYPRALALATRALDAHPQSDRALLVAGEASLELRDASSGIAHLARVSGKDARLLSLARRDEGRLKLNAFRPLEAEALLREAVRADPGDALARDQLIYLLTLEGRAREARELILRQLRSGVVTANYLIISERHRPSLEMAVSYAERCLAVSPDETLPRLVLAQKAWRDNQPDAAREHLEQVIRTHPEIFDSQTLYCEIVAETGDWDEFLRMQRLLPESAADHADLWQSRGMWAEQAGQISAAARCYWEAARLEPTYPQPSYRLAQVLTKLGRTEEARVFAERAKELTALSLEMSSMSGKLNPEKLRSIIGRLEALGRSWEAAGWCQIVLLETGLLPPWARQTQLRLTRELSTCDSFTAASRDPSQTIDLSSYPLPVFPDPAEQAPAKSPPDGSNTTVQFAEEAGDVGLTFTYRNGAGGDDELESMLEMNGGGVAVLDYDGDHWPDVFFTQGGRLPPAEFDAAESDQLFRNLGGAFVNVTRAAGLHDIGYGQGVTVGDYDSDGFPDLYVGNIGRNQFYRNNGDGTFSDVTAETGTQAGGWTSSSVLADFNRDGLPDLYVVTYLGGKDIFRPCHKRAHPRCSPTDFTAEPDRFYLNLGDGRFQDLSDTHGLSAADGRGLGVVAADFDGSGRLSLFVANDMSANFFFVNRTDSPDDFQFEEAALLSGLAYDQVGQAKACMGVAAGDMNGDGKIDLFVTNFYRQSNDFYVHQPDGSFRDASREARLYEPSFLLLGWGTQCLDADLDGLPDLLVANGHVHDPVKPQIPYRMPPQFFRNLGDGTFAEIPGRQLGDFFLQPALGRALARLDWNRDGREDGCLSHLDSPAALLTNRTPDAGHFLALKLVGVESARDAIGTHVRVTAGGRTRYQQLTAGDGFQASNERRLVFGLGTADAIDAVEILWPSGRRQMIQSLPADGEWIVVEGQPPLENVGALRSEASRRG